MEAKEKAKDLVHKIQWNTLMSNKKCKICALIIVDEITNLKLLWFQKDTKDLQYWNDVEQEINKL